MLPVSKICVLFFLAISIATTSGCSSVGVEESAELSLEFAGIASIEYNTERQETSLNWLLANSNADSVSYKIHELQLESLDQLGLEVQDPSTMDGLAHRVYLFDNQDLAQRIVSEGKVLAQLGADITQFQLGTALNPNSNYAYVIKVNAEGIADPNSKVLLLQSRVKDFLATNTYTGCLTGESASPGTITINFENPEVASKIDIKRDGVLVFSTTNSLTTSFTDMGLAAGSQFTYSCEATIGSDIAVGTQALTLSPQDFSYEGCTSATALSESEIELAFAIPVNADRMRIYRNSKEIFSTTKKSVTNFVDEDLKLGRTYKYLCEVEIGELTVEGSTVLQATTLDPVANTEFNGCTSVASLSPTSTQVIFDFPTGAERINVYRDGVQVFSSFSAENTSFTDENLSTGENYEYSCELVIGGRSKFGAEVSGGTVDAIGNINANWQGCVSATAIGTDSIQVIFDRPSDVDAINLYRDGALIFNSTRASITQYVDSTLKEGFTYTYTCEAVSGDKTLTGENILSAKTLVSSPPTFAGPLSATDVDGNSIQVTWRPASGVPTDHYVVYYQHGSTLDYSTATTQLVGGSMQSVTLDSIGDELTYSIGVRACHDPEETICDSNTTSITLTTQDAGAPQTRGATAAQMNDGDLVITAPWEHANGLVKTRNVYLRAGSTGGTNLSNYNLSASIAVADPLNTPTSLSVSGVSESTTYQVIVVDLDNSSATSAHQPITVQTGDLTAPDDFLGIASSGHTTPAQGAVAVKYVAPSDWSDYAGFKVYSVSGSELTLLGDCACTNLDCDSNRPSSNSCTVTGLDARRTYDFHVRAYDLAGNITETDLSRKASVQTSDTTSPQGLCCIGGEYNSSSSFAEINYSQASDNQYSSEPGAEITYELYRKAISDFADATTPESDGKRIYSAADTASLEDIGPFSTGDVYYYIVCANDASNNRSCSDGSQMVTIPDLENPTVSSFAHNRTDRHDDIDWDLTWSMSDSTSAIGDMKASVYRKHNQTASDTASTTDTLIGSVEGLQTLTGLTGVPDFDGYLHYLLVVEDEAGNTATATLTLQDTNSITIERALPDEIKVNETPYVVIEGSGFMEGATVTIGGSNCTSTQVHSPNIISCIAPSFANPNSHDIVVTNSEGSSNELSSSFSTCTDSCNKYCNTNYSETAEGFAAGDGSESDPFLICTVAQLSEVKDEPHVTYFKLGANIDLSQNPDYVPLVSDNSTRFTGTFDGFDYAILNHSYDDASLDFVGFFRIIQTSTVENLKVLNSSLVGQEYVGALSGQISNANNTVSNIFVSGNVSGNGIYTGGAVGRVSDGVNLILADWEAHVDVTSNTESIGGLIGNFVNTDAGSSISGKWIALGDVTATSNPGSVGGAFGVFGAQNMTFTASPCIARGNVTAPNSNLVGGFIGSGGVFTITIDGCSSYGDITGHSSVGGFIGGFSTSGGDTGVISHSYAYGNVTALSPTSYAGGFVGNSGNNRRVTFDSNQAHGDVTGFDSLGGFIGFVSATGSDPIFRNNKAYGDVTASTGDKIGGFIGDFHATSSGAQFLYNQVIDSTVSGNTIVGGFIGGTIGDSHIIRGNYTNAAVHSLNQTVGGFAGSFGVSTTSEISNNFSSGDVSGASTHVGGFVGNHNSTSSRSNGTKSTVEQTSSYSAGGFAGTIYVQADFSILDSYAYGTVTTSDTGGGFAGFLDGANDSDTLTMDRNFANVDVISAADYSGGFIGQMHGDDFVVSINQCVAHGDVDSAQAGGFFGVKTSSAVGSLTITDSLATGDTICDDNNCTSFIPQANLTTINTSYSRGFSIQSGSLEINSSRNVDMIDNNGPRNNTIANNNFFDSTRANSTNTSVFTAADFSTIRDQSTFTTATWDFTDDWFMPTWNAPPIPIAHTFRATYASGQYDFAWPAHPDVGTDYVLIGRQGGFPTFVPQNGTSYSANQSVGDSTVIYVGSSLTASHTGITDRHGWQYRLFVDTGSYTYYHIGLLSLPDQICDNLAGGEWVYVPQDSERNLDGFCVMKYEAREQDSEPFSRLRGTPWVSLSQSTAITECDSLGANYDLISNAQWVSLASNIAGEASNWSGGQIGSGALNQGHSDGSPNGVLTANSDFSPCAYTGEESSCSKTTWNSQRRTFALSTGELIWDVAGNAAEFTSDDDNAEKPGTDSTWTELFYSEYGSTYPKNTIISTNAQKSWWKDTWTSAHGIGQIYTDSTGGVFVRGGRYNEKQQKRAGIFQLDTSMTNTDTANNVGFRCVYTFP